MWIKNLKSEDYKNNKVFKIFDPFLGNIKEEPSKTNTQ